MTPVVGWVSNCKGSELEIRLKTGPRFTIPRRPNLKWGDSVRVFYDYDKMRPGQIILLDDLHLMGAEREATWGEEDNPWTDDEILGIVDSL